MPPVSACDKFVLTFVTDFGGKELFHFDVFCFVEEWKPTHPGYKLEFAPNWGDELPAFQFNGNAFAQFGTKAISRPV